MVVIHEGLKLARKMNLEDILFISDSFHTATLIKNGVQGCHRYVTLIRNIIDFAKEDWGPRRVRGQLINAPRRRLKHAESVSPLICCTKNDRESGN